MTYVLTENLAMQIDNKNIHKAIVASAIIGEDGRVYIGARHTHCFMALATAGVKQYDNNKQGFVTAGGEFLNRHEAKVRASELGQIKEGCGKYDILYSEDLR